MAIQVQKKGFALRMKNPVLTPYWGIWVPEPGNKNAHSLSRTRKMIRQFISQIPKQFLVTEFHLIPEWTDALHFEWSGFQNSILYTFRIPANVSLDERWQLISSSKRRAIRTANQLLTVVLSDDTQILATHIRETYQDKGINIPYPATLPGRLFAALSPDRACLLIAKNGKHPVGSLLLVWDDKVMYNLIPAIPSVGRTLHAGHLLLWKAIQLAHEKELIFDFEGSMIQDIATFYHDFGGVVVPYLSVIKGKTKCLRGLYQTMMPRLR
ncbi:MAG: GNAT family N-acetyltransferase [Saprospiraceae bacterium]|nr:GNAT family N-acetyltransferase [Saprospiraceae bacterium]